MDIPEHYRDTFGGTREPTRKLDVGVLDMGTGRMHGNDNVHLIALPLELAQLDAANMYQDQIADGYYYNITLTPEDQAAHLREVVEEAKDELARAAAESHHRFF